MHNLITLKMRLVEGSGGRIVFSKTTNLTYLIISSIIVVLVILIAPWKAQSSHGSPLAILCSKAYVQPGQLGRAPSTSAGLRATRTSGSVARQVCSKQHPQDQGLVRRCELETLRTTN